MTRATLALSLFASLALGAAAQDATYSVQGDDVAGRATLQGDRLQVEATRFSKRARKGEPFQLSARVTRRDARGLGLSWSRQSGFLGAMFGDGQEQVTAELASAGAGWAGELEGAQVRLVPEQAPLKDLVVLVVPGLSTNLWNQYGVPYLDENLAVLKARGFEARRLAINTEEAVAVNAVVIADEVRGEIARGKRVLLIAHSKGGADTITALSNPANLDLLDHVVGLIAIQPVYAGSPVADEVGKSGLVQGLADKAFECIFPLLNREDDRGSGLAVRDLRSEARRALLELYPYPADRIPTVVIRGHFSGRAPVKFGRHVLCQPLVGLQVFLEKRRGLQSDGMVSLANQSIPGAVAEHTYADLDHFEPGFRNESPHTPAAITGKALDLMLPRLALPKR